MNYMFSGAAASGAAARQAQLSASSAASKATQANTKADLMQADVEKLFMITEALWTILRDRMGLVDEDLIKIIKEIDMQDGRMDGRVAKQANAACPDCGRTLLGRHPACLYCGAVVDRNPFER